MSKNVAQRNRASGLRRAGRDAGELIPVMIRVPSELKRQLEAYAGETFRSGSAAAAYLISSNREFVEWLGRQRAAA